MNVELATNKIFHLEGLMNMYGLYNIEIKKRYLIKYKRSTIK